MDMTRFARRLGIGLFASVFGGGLAVAQGWQHLGKVQRVEKLKDGVELTAGTAKVRLTVFRDGVFRVRVAPNGTFPKDFSWAVIESPEPPAVKFEENQTELKIAAGNVVATIQRSPLLINFCDPAGNVLLADEPNLPMAWNGRRVHAWKKMPADENYFGLGDKAGPMNRRNRAFTDWNTDEFGWQESSDPLYKTIPFFIGLRNGLAYGLFFDNTYRIYFDIDYQQGNAPFTINREYFPTFEKMIADFRAQGMHTILITDLHIKKDPNHAYAPYDSGMKNDVFVKNPDGSVFVGTVWPGESVFPDFTLTRVRDWWGGLYKDFVGMGAAGFWNDMNEPALFLRADKTMPLDVVHRLDDGTTLDHRAIHNIYGMQNVRATYDGLRKLQANERPFVLTRAAYSGAQRYSGTWTGDNSSTWNHLKMSTPMLLSMGISGFPLIGDDIGGFAGSPTADLLTRWFEVGALNPIYRDHTAKGTADQEPWVHGPEHEAIRRRYMELRYMLMPYLYTGIEEASRTGLPLMRPVFLEYPHASDFYGDNRDFLFGRDFFAAPVTTEMVDAEEISFPPGEWYDFWTNTKLSSKEKLSLHPRLDEMPLYVRAGAIVPMQPLVQSTEEKPKGPLQLRVYLPSSASDSDCRGTLYQDDGHTFAYQKGEILRVNYSCQVSNGSVTVTSNTEKIAYHPWWNSAELRLVGTTVAPKEVRIGDQVTREWRYDGLAHSVTLTVPDAARNWTVRLAF